MRIIKVKSKAPSIKKIEMISELKWSGNITKINKIETDCK